MTEKPPEDAAEIAQDSAPKAGKVRLLSLDDLDGRTRAAQHVRDTRQDVMADGGCEAPRCDPARADEGTRRSSNTNAPTIIAWKSVLGLVQIDTLPRAVARRTGMLFCSQAKMPARAQHGLSTGPARASRRAFLTVGIWN